MELTPTLARDLGRSHAEDMNLSSWDLTDARDCAEVAAQQTDMLLTGTDATIGDPAAEAYRASFASTLEGRL